MTQDQSQPLGALRAELDRIDNQILDLIERRLSLSLEVAAAKDAEGDRHLKLRPRRQAEIVDRLKKRCKRAAPELIEQVWREIMAHSLQAQTPMEIVLAPSDEPELLQARVRAHFGSAAPVRWAASKAHALRAALVGEAVAVLGEPPVQGQGELRIFDVLADGAGHPIAYAVGRVGLTDMVLPPPSPRASGAVSGAPRRSVATDTLWLG